jgi:hypothetical protein
VTKRATVERFLETGEWLVEPDLETVSVEPGGPLDPAWLADIRAWRADLAGCLDRFREFFHKPAMTREELDALLAEMEMVVATPELFFDGMQRARDEAQPEGVVIDFLRGLPKIPFLFPTRDLRDDQRAELDKLRARYPVLAGVDVNPNDHHFELPDPGWWRLIKGGLLEHLGTWPDLAPFAEHTFELPFVYPASPDANRVALIADFGVAQYHSHAIARTLARAAYPYVFHLGDVYYSGTHAELAMRYSAVLDPVMSKSTLFSMPENHELFSGGHPYQAFLRNEKMRGRIVQDGSYFCVRFAKHQIIALDVNWHGRRRFKPDRLSERAWFEAQLAHGLANDLTTILLTGNAPYCYGDHGKRKLFDDLLEYQHRFHMWFWGDDHYCALFPHTAATPFVGSCIGHGGYPGDRQQTGEPCFVEPVWLETAPRFPIDTDLRHDLGNNGWCELALLDSGGVELLYVDWLGCKRAAATYEPAVGANGRFLRLVSRVEDLGRNTLVEAAR